MDSNVCIQLFTLNTPLHMYTNGACLALIVNLALSNLYPTFCTSLFNLRLAAVCRTELSDVTFHLQGTTPFRSLEMKVAE